MVLPEFPTILLWILEYVSERATIKEAEPSSLPRRRR